MGDVIIEKVAGGLGRQEVSNDSASGMIVQMDAIVGGVQSGTAYKLNSLADAEALLITEANDYAQKVLAWHNIQDFFRIAPGADLWFTIADDFTTTDDIKNGVDNILAAAGGEVRQIAFIHKGVDADNAAQQERILQMQIKCAEAETQKQPFEGVVGGYTDPLTPFDYRAQNSPNVSVVLAQNHAISTKNLAVLPTVDLAYIQQTLIGLKLGSVANSAVNENTGWVRKNNVFGGNLTVAGLYLDGGLGGTSYAITDVSESQFNALDAAGAIFLKIYPQKAGIYWNDTHTCTEITSDFAYIENNRTINKANRLIYQALLPDVNSPIQVDPNSGQLSPELCKAFELKGRRALDQMFTAEEISGANVIVDPAQNILATSELVVEFEITPTGTARTIRVKIGFINPFNS